MLEGPAIRTFNKIIKYLDDNNIMDVSSIIPKESIEEIHVEAKSTSKSAIIQTITSQKLESFFRDKDIGILNPGEELHDSFIDFLAISNTVDEEIIMISKLKKAIKDIKESKYFRYFGVIPRTGVINPSDPNNSFDNDPAILKMLKNYSMTQLNVENISERDLAERTKFAISQWKIKKYLQIRTDETVRRAVEKFKSLLKKNKAKKKPIHDTLRLPDRNNPNMKKGQNCFSSLYSSSFRSVDWDEEGPRSDMRQIRKKFGLAVNQRY